ncbi:MAG: DUF3021 domain-containing protein [Acetatifactor sp.]|nr:DUF3021 domain-containing protein [Acetatifactor sp.]
MLSATYMQKSTVAYLMQWMSRNTAGILLYFDIFFIIYLLIRLSQYQTMKKKIKQINHKIQEGN